MALVTRNTKPLSDYQQWHASGITNGDVLGVEESLGHPAHSVTIESLGGQTYIKFNVVDKVTASQRWANSWLQDAAFYDKPGLVTEQLNLTSDTIIIEEDATETWTDEELTIRDIYIELKAPALKITIT